MELNKKRENNVSSFNSDSHNPEERFLIGMFGQITERLKNEYNYSRQEIFKLWGGENAIQIPIIIFAGKLSPAEALAKFLRENCSLGYSEISELIGASKNSAWANYKRAIKKVPWHFEINDSIAVPVSIFNSEKSVLESLVSYLKDAEKLRNKKIAQLLNKNPSNISALYGRAKKKAIENGN